MSLLTDLRAVSENAVEQLAARFSDLPRPLLAAIGAGDMAVARLADLRESLTDTIGERVAGSAVDVSDVRSAVSDLPSRAQKVAAEVAGNIEHFAAEAPGKAQDLIAQLPEKLAELQSAAQSLSPDNVKETVEAYTQLVGMIYGNLADRGEQTWTKVKASGLRPGAVVDAAATKVRSATKPASPRPAAAKAATVKPAASKPTAVKPTATKAAPKPRAPRATTAKTGSAKPAAPNA